MARITISAYEITGLKGNEVSDFEAKENALFKRYETKVEYCEQGIKISAEIRNKAEFTKFLDEFLNLAVSEIKTKKQFTP